MNVLNHLKMDENRFAHVTPRKQKRKDRLEQRSSAMKAAQRAMDTPELIKKTLQHSQLQNVSKDAISFSPIFSKTKPANKTLFEDSPEKEKEKRPPSASKPQKSGLKKPKTFSSTIAKQVSITSRLRPRSTTHPPGSPHE